jgi:hypothetical protein
VRGELQTVEKSSEKWLLSMPLRFRMKTPAVTL